MRQVPRAVGAWLTAVNGKSSVETTGPAARAPSGVWVWAPSRQQRRSTPGRCDAGPPGWRSGGAGQKSGRDTPKRRRLRRPYRPQCSAPTRRTVPRSRTQPRGQRAGAGRGGAASPTGWDLLRCGPLRSRRRDAARQNGRTRQRRTSAATPARGRPGAAALGMVRMFLPASCTGRRTWNTHVPC